MFTNHKAVKASIRMSILSEIYLGMLRCKRGQVKAIDFIN